MLNVFLCRNIEKVCGQAICIQACTLAGGGKVFGHDEIHIAYCNDGMRPVVFRLEAIEDDEPQLF